MYYILNVLYIFYYIFYNMYRYFIRYYVIYVNIQTIFYIYYIYIYQLNLHVASLMFGVKHLDTGRKLNAHKMFRICPGCLLNVYVRSIYHLFPGGITSQAIVLVFLDRNICFSVWASKRRGQFFPKPENYLKFKWLVHNGKRKAKGIKLKKISGN